MGAAIASVAFFILGLVIVPANFGYFGDAGGPETCELKPMIALTIPFAIVCLACGCCLSSTCLAGILLCCGVINLDDMPGKESTATMEEGVDNDVNQDEVVNQMEAGDKEDST